MIDELLTFSDKQEIKADSTSDNIIYLGNREIAFGNPVYLDITVAETISGIDSLKVSVLTSDKEDMSSPVELASSSVAVADLKQGTKIPLAFFPSGNKGYAQLKYTLDNPTEANGKISAFLTDGVQQSFHN